MLKLTYSSHGHRNFRAAFARSISSMHRRLKRNALPIGLSALAIIALAQTGCSSSIRNLTNDLNSNLLIEYRDAIWSRRAYNLRYGNCDRPYSNHYRDGFCAGYMDVCNGGDGYVPALPPSEYRGYEYQSAEGAKCVNTWFEGYPAGVAAAKQDKSGEYKDMFISKMIDSAVTQDNAKHQLPGDVPILKPRPSAQPEKGISGTDSIAPPTPELSRAWQTAVELDSDAGVAHSASNFTQQSPVSVMETASSKTSKFNQVRPALPPIVKGKATPSDRSPQVTSARPSEQSPQPMPIIRQANASVITNQFAR